MIAGLSAAKAAVASGHQATSRAAITILEEGGNVVDAVLAAALTSFACEPVLAGPYGGAVGLLKLGSRRLALNFFCRTPHRKSPEALANSTEVIADFGTSKQAFTIGAASSAASSLLNSLLAMHGKYGQMPLKNTILPAQNICQGLAMNAFQARLLQIVAPIVSATPSARSLFTDGSTILQEGQQLVNLDLPNLLRDLVTYGTQVLAENSPLATAILETQYPAKGHLLQRDMTLLGETCDPDGFAMGDWRFWTTPQISLGAARVKAMLADFDAKHRRAELAMIAAMQSAQRDRPPRPIVSRGTIHISIVTGNGDAVSLTLTNGEGNGELVPGYGFMLNNMLGELDVCPQGVAGWQPDQALATMMVPLLAEHEDGRIIVLGSGGSSRIPGAVFQVAARLCLMGNHNLAQAIIAPRVHLQADTLDIECAHEQEWYSETPMTPQGSVNAWPERNMYFGGVHGAMKSASRQACGLVAFGDPRRDGAAMAI